METREDSKYSLADVIDMGVRDKLVQMYITLPATVVSYDKKTQTIEAKISIERTISGGMVKYPNLRDIPVKLPRNSKGGLSFFLYEGDEVTLQFIQRSTGNWRTKGPGFPPDFASMFDINDAIAIPCLHPVEVPYEQREATEVMGDKVFVDAVESAQVTAPKIFLGDKEGSAVKTSGLSAGGVSGVTPEVISILEGLVAALTIPWQTPTGPATPVPGVVTDLGNIKILLGQLKGTAE